MPSRLSAHRYYGYANIFEQTCYYVIFSANTIDFEDEALAIFFRYFLLFRSRHIAAILRIILFQYEVEFPNTFEST